MSVDPITMIAILVAGYVALMVTMRVLKRMRRTSDLKPISYDFTVAELNDMLRSGMLSADEFEKMKSAVIRRSFKRPMAPFPPTPEMPPPEPPANPTQRGFEVLPKPADPEKPKAPDA